MTRLEKTVRGLGHIFPLLIGIMMSRIFGLDEIYPIIPDVVDANMLYFVGEVVSANSLFPVGVLVVAMIFLYVSDMH